MRCIKHIYNVEGPLISDVSSFIRESAPFNRWQHFVDLQGKLRACGECRFYEWKTIVTFSYVLVKLEVDFLKLYKDI